MISHRVLSIAAVIATAILVCVNAQSFNRVQVGNWVLDVSDAELPWIEAVTVCKLRNASLLSVDTEEKDRTLVDLFIDGASTDVPLPGNNTWISAAETREGVWQWDSLNEPMYYQRWYIGQPDDTENLNCVYMATQGMLYWRDANCSAPMFFICESNL